MGIFDGIRDTFKKEEDKLEGWYHKQHAALKQKVSDVAEMALKDYESEIKILQAKVDETRAKLRDIVK